MLKKYTWHAATLALVVAACSVVYMLQPQAPYAEAATIANGTKTFDELSDRFTDLAHEKGATYAFEVLKRAVIPPNTDLHLLGHAVGEILYEQKGVEGIAECTQDFRNACSHTIVVGALQDYNEGALPMIREACKKAPGGPGAYTMCYHGLGHGVLAYFQYELPQTIALCKKTGTPEYQNREYIECVGGAIMELMGGGGHDPEAWKASRKKYLTSTLAPCTSSFMPREVQGMCLNYLTPRIWEEVGMELGVPDPSQFDEAFAVCDTLADPELRDACGGGFGKEFIPLAAARDIRSVTDLNEMQMREVLTWCSSASARDLTISCVKSALQSLFWGGENDPAASFLFCSIAGDDSQNACYRELESAIFMYSENRRDELCKNIPIEFRTTCLVS